MFMITENFFINITVEYHSNHISQYCEGFFFKSDMQYLFNTECKYYKYTIGNTIFQVNNYRWVFKNEK